MSGEDEVEKMLQNAWDARQQYATYTVKSDPLPETLREYVPVVIGKAEKAKQLLQNRTLPNMQLKTEADYLLAEAYGLRGSMDTAEVHMLKAWLGTRFDKVDESLTDKVRGLFRRYGLVEDAAVSDRVIEAPPQSQRKSNPIQVVEAESVMRDSWNYTFDQCSKVPYPLRN